MTAEPGQVGASAFHLDNLNVTFSTPEGDVHAVRNLSLAVAPGECLGVVGESGAGKSQAFLAALGLLPANGRASGHARLGPLELIGMPEADLDRIRGARIGLVFQDPMTSLTPHIRIGDQIAEPLIRHAGISSRDASSRALRLLNQVHVTDAERRMRQYPHELSGGMCQRVMIAIALACDPTLLIADEPTTALDVTIQAQILSLLVELKRSRGMSMVLITHDMGAVAGVADRVAVMRAGEVVEVDTVNAVFRAPRHEHTRALLAALPRIDVAAGPVRGGVAGKAGRPGGAAGSAAVGGAAATHGEGGSPVAAGAGRGAADALVASAGLSTSAAALVLDNIRVQFNVRGRWFAAPQVLRAVDGVSLELAVGEAVGVVGESGSGKSTLARAALQLIRAQSGRVVWLGRPVDALSQSELKPLRRDMQIIFQDPLASLDPRMTAGEIVGEPLQVHRPDLDRAAAEAAVSEALARVRLDPALATRYPHELSGGQCQRIGIARAMVLQPRLLICDEPVSALDVTVQEQIVRLLADLKRESGLAILFISHNLAVVRQLCERILVLYLGRMMELAPAAAVYSRPLHPYTRELLESAPIPDPDVQPARLTRALLGEPPSPLSPPSGCVYRTRCPHAVDVCRERVPEWERAGGASQWVACHRWQDLASHPETPI
ncbi:MAG: transporter ATP-binding protein [Gammaproteobacteria bacterium]|nr:transporter ATP-binding protein [Gammaproteobacteria bacterium]